MYMNHLSTRTIPPQTIASVAAEIAGLMCTLNVYINVYIKFTVRENSHYSIGSVLY